MYWKFFECRLDDSNKINKRHLLKSFPSKYFSLSKCYNVKKFFHFQIVSSFIFEFNQSYIVRVELRTQFHVQESFEKLDLDFFALLLKPFIRVYNLCRSDKVISATRCQPRVNDCFGFFSQPCWKLVIWQFRIRPTSLQSSVNI